MSNPTRHQLLGYLLDAVEPDERVQIEEQLQRDETLRRELELLQSSLHPLTVDREHHQPPPGLAKRCCEYVLSRTEIMPAALSPPQGNAAAPARRHRWSWLDISVAGAIAAAVAVLILPAIYQSRLQSIRAACQNNLKDIGTAVASYSDRHGGLYPEPLADQRLNVAGMWAPTLISQGYLPKSGKSAVCPSSNFAKDSNFHLPTLEELQAMSPAQLSEIYPRIAGYGFTLGYVDGENGAYKIHRNLHRPNFAVAADPPGEGPSNSPNHGGDGQNVLFEDLHIKYLNSSKVGDDDIYRNANQQIAPGLHMHDAVIVPSQVHP